jgi:hypothetical protein
MSGSVTVEPDPAFPAGHAIIRVHGGGQFDGRPDFRIRRNDYDEGVYGHGGWQVADALLEPDSVSIEANDMLLHIGPPIVQHIVSGIYLVSIPGAGLETSVHWPDLPLLPDDTLNMVAEAPRASDRTIIVQRPRIERPAAKAQLLPPETELQVIGSANSKGDETEPDPDDTLRMRLSKVAPLLPVVDNLPAKPRHGKWLLWTAPLLVLLAAGGAYYEYPDLFKWWKTPEKPASPLASSDPSKPPAPARGGRDLTRMSAAEVAASGASPEVVFQEAQRRMKLDADGRNAALLLMQDAATHGYAPAHTALGRLYDTRAPRLPDVPPDMPVDERQAACHYRDAIRGGDNSVAGARADLRKRLEASADSDRNARPTLRDCWP